VLVRVRPGAPIGFRRFHRRSWRSARAATARNLRKWWTRLTKYQAVSEIGAISQVIADDLRFKRLTHSIHASSSRWRGGPIPRTSAGSNPTDWTNHRTICATSAIGRSADMSLHVPDANDPPPTSICIAAAEWLRFSNAQPTACRFGEPTCQIRYSITSLMMACWTTSHAVFGLESRGTSCCFGGCAPVSAGWTRNHAT
jgi:hypothetical protein